MLLKADKTNKLTPNFDCIPRKVVEKDGRKVTVEDEEGNMTTRDSSFLKEYYGDNETQCVTNNNSTSDTINSGKQRNKRNIHPPVRFKDYCMCYLYFGCGVILFQFHILRHMPLRLKLRKEGM